MSVGGIVFGCLLLAATALLLHPARWLVDRYLPGKESGLPLAWFRIGYASVLFCEVSQLVYFQPLVADPIPFVERSEVQLGYALVVWQVALVCLAVGLFTRASAGINYLMTLATISTFHSFEYHVDYVYTCVNLLLVFAPISARLSVDRLVWRLGRPAEPEPSGEVSQLHPLLFVLFGIAAVYFDSVFHKLDSSLWLRGLGVWLPASFPQMTWLDYTPLLDREWLVRGMGYLALGLELVFVFLIWFRRMRTVLLVIGMGLHLGITAVFPIPWFGLAMVSLYLLLVPAEWYQAAGSSLRSVLPPLETAALRARLRPLVVRLAAMPGFDAGMAPLGSRGLLVALVTFLLVSQAVATAQAPLIRNAANAVGLGLPYARVAAPARAFTASVSRPFAGVTRHDVFLDDHFAGYEHVVSVAYVDADGHRTWLPFYDEQGGPSAHMTGRVWAYWTMRIVSARNDPKRLGRGLERMTAFWAHKYGVPLEGARFVVRAKRIEAPTAWEQGLLRRQMQRPWMDVGQAGWEGGRFWYAVNDIESL